MRLSGTSGRVSRRSTEGRIGGRIVGGLHYPRPRRGATREIEKRFRRVEMQLYGYLQQGEAGSVIPTKSEEGKERRIQRRGEWRASGDVFKYEAKGTNAEGLFVFVLVGHV